MNLSTQTDTAIRTESMLARVDALLEHAERLTKTDASPADFHRDVLGELINILSAAAATVWSIRSETVSLLFDSRGELDRAVAQTSAELIGRLDADRTVLIPPQVDGRLPNATEFARCVSSASLAPSLRMVVDVSLPATAQRGENIGEIVAAVTAMLVEFHRGRQLARLLSESQDRDRIAGVCRDLHSTMDRDRIATILVNDGATGLKVDRVSVLLPSSLGTLRLRAVTSVNALNHRANDCRAMEVFVEQLQRAAVSPIWWQSVAADSGGSSNGDVIHNAADTYLRETGSLATRVVPLSPTCESWDDAVGAVVVEQFHDNRKLPDDPAIREIAWHAFAAFQNADRLRSSGLSGQLRLLRERVLSGRTSVFAATLIGALIALVAIPVSFELEAQGQVQPVRRRHVFAPTNGVITSVAAGTGATVAEGAVLLMMRNPELDLEEQRVRGEIATTAARLASVRAARVEQDRRGAGQASAAQLTAEEEELKQTAKSLDRQLEILSARLSELTMKAPIGGQVVRGDLLRSLELRPVRQGDALLQIADTDGPWELELRIPDRAVRHVLIAHEQAADGLPVRFLFRMSPKSSYSGKLTSINSATDLDPQNELSTLGRVPLDGLKLPELRPGSSVVAKIHCGHRSLGYVWLREFWEFLQTQVLF